MIRGVGVDICRCCRFEGKERRFLERIFSTEELSVSTSPEYLASRFAAKEAFSKALGTGIRGFSLTDVTVREDEAGKPYFHLEGRALSISSGLSFHLSLSHEREYAVAMVVAE